MSSRPLIVLVEDDAVIAELIEFNLQNEGYATRHFSSGMALFQALGEVNFPPKTLSGDGVEEPTGLGPVALFILDVMLPGFNGFEICARLKSDPKFELTPVMMLTARSAEQDKVQGLNIGADDYLTKPFGMREFLARVQAQVRRFHKLSDVNEKIGYPQPDADASTGDYAQAVLPSGVPLGEQPGEARKGVLRCRDIVLDDVRHRVFKGDEEIDVTNREYELLKFLLLHRGIAYSRDDLLNYVWGYEYTGETRTVDVHIRQLRRKLDDEDEPSFVETVRGRGYRCRED